MSPRRRWSLITLAALATGVITYLAPEGSKPVEVAAPVQRAEALPAVVRSQAPMIIDLPSRQPIGRQRGDIFATRSWAPPPAVQKPEAPKAPPNPYRFAGTAQHDGKRKVFLMLGDRVVEAKEGEMLEQGFRVKSVTDQAVTLVYGQIPDQAVIIAFSDAPAPASAPPAATGASAPPAPDRQVPAPR